MRTVKVIAAAVGVVCPFMPRVSEDKRRIDPVVNGFESAVDVFTPLIDMIIDTSVSVAVVPAVTAAEKSDTVFELYIFFNYRVD